MKKSIAAILLFSCTTSLKAQHSGNVVYGYNASKNIEPLQKNYLTDSTFIVSANILMNVIADSYVVTFGVADSAATIQESNNRIEKRIQSFINSLSKLNITQKDVYVDMTTQNKIFDYHIKGNLAEQYLKAFEIQKNVIIKFSNIKDLDAILMVAANDHIYDLVKVDYIVNEPDKIEARLFKLAKDVIDQKKELYATATNVKLLPSAQIYGSSFESYFPTQLYKSYTAQPGSKIYADYDRMVKKDLKTTTTVYYDKINYSGFDKVIDPAVVEPAVEFVLGLQIKFQIDKSKK